MQNAERRTQNVIITSLLLCTGAVLPVHGQLYIPPDYYPDGDKGSTCYRANEGQVHGTDGDPYPSVAFYTEGSPVGIHLQEKSVVSYTWAAMYADSVTPDSLFRIDLKFTGSNEVQPAASGTKGDVANYYIGAITAEEVKAHHRIYYYDLYSKIDLHYHHGTSGPRMSFVVRPGGDPSDIRMHFDGQDSLGVDVSGALKLYLDGRWVKLEQAVAYQVSAFGTIIPIGWTAVYDISGGATSVKFGFDTFSSTMPLVFEIGYPPLALGGEVADPRNLTWCSYVGGNGGEELTAVEVDGVGNPYVCGYTFSTNFPVAPGTEVFEPFQGLGLGWFDGVVQKYSDDNKQLIWATYYGGSESDAGEPHTQARKLAVYDGPLNDLNYVFVTGSTNTSDFLSYRDVASVFANAHSEEYDGGIRRTWIGAFRKSDGRRDWSTTHGETGDNTWAEDGLAIDIESSGKLVVGGRLRSYDSSTPDFPSVTPSGAWNRNDGGAFFISFNENYQIDWSTTFASRWWSTQLTDLRVLREDSKYFLWFTGTDGGGAGPLDVVPPPPGGYYQEYALGDAAMLALVNLSDRTLDYCTYWSSTEDYASTLAYALDITDKHIWVVGCTSADDLTLAECPNPGGTGVHHSEEHQPTTFLQWSDGFILRFERTTKALTYGTLIGGSKDDILLDVGHDAQSIYITGETRSATGFAEDLAPDRFFQPQFGNGNKRDAILLALVAEQEQPAMRWRSALGGSESDRGWGIASNGSEVYVVGATASNFWQGPFPLFEFDSGSPLDYFQDYNFGGSGVPFLDWYEFPLALTYEHQGEFMPESIGTPYDGFIASFNIQNSVGLAPVSHALDMDRLHITPLPVPHTWVVQFSGPEQRTILIVDALGKEVAQLNATGSSALLDLSAQAAGLYIVRVQQANGSLGTAKILRP